MSRSRDFPEDGELVVCTVKDVKNFGAFVSLDEYGDKEGFIHVREVASGWVKYIKDYIREGQKVVCKVLGVDSSKGHIDLSLKSVNDHQKREKNQQRKNEKKAEKLMEIIAEKISISVDEAYDMFGIEMLDAYDTLYGAFENVAADPDAFRKEYKGDWVEIFIDTALENIVPPFVQIDGILELHSNAPDGIERIRTALIKGMEAAGEETKVEIHSVGTPRYRIVITADDYKSAEDVMKKVSSTAIDSMVAAGGEAVLKRESK